MRVPIGGLRVASADDAPYRRYLVGTVSSAYRVTRMHVGLAKHPLSP